MTVKNQNNLKSPCILVADDSSTMRNFLTRVLDQDYNIITAEDGVDCLEKYSRNSPSVIVLDLMMPKMDGFGVIDQVRNKYNDQNVIIIVLTGEDEQEIKAKALNCGANDYLTKPFHVVELKARVGVAVRQVMLSQRLHAANLQLKKAYDIIDAEVKLVSRLQDKLLPTTLPTAKGLCISKLYEPSGRASGDYYDVIQISEKVYRVVIADVSGHGPQAAFIMAIVRTLAKAEGMERLSLVKSFQQINQHLLDLIGDDSYFVTVFAADINFNTGEISFINAGHCPVLIQTDNNKISEIPASIPPLGFFPVEPEKNTLLFKDMLKLFLFTDGCYEWHDGKDYFTLEKFVEIISEQMANQSFNVENLKEILHEKTGVNPVFGDDVTALWINWKKK